MRTNGPTFDRVVPCVEMAGPIFTSPLVNKLPVIAWSFVKVLAAPSSGTTVGSIARIPLVVIGPPVSPGPDPTLVSVPPPPPPPETVVHHQAWPFHARTCPMEQLVSRLR